MTKSKTDILITQSQKLTLSLQMKQSLFIMQLNRMELKDYLKEQLEDNPLLEIDDDGYFSKQDQDFIQAEFYQTETSLVDVLLEQLAYSDITNKALGEYIIYSLDEHGYLKDDFKTIAKIKKTSMKEVKEVVQIIQYFEPLGVAAKDMYEALQIQASRIFPDDIILEKIISDHLVNIANNKMSKILMDINITQEELEVCLRKLRTLEPRPGNGYAHQPISFIEPDMEFVLVDNKLQAKLLNVPKVSVKNIYHQQGLSKEDKKTIQKFIREGNLLIDFLNKRNLSLLSIVDTIILVQGKVFLEKKPLQVLRLKDIADKCNMHLSTVSRIMKQKYFLFDNQLYPLHILLSKKTRDGSSVEYVKHLIDMLIKQESEALSDQTLYTILNKQGIQCSRRVITKYRSELGYPSSYMRNKEEKRTL